MISRFDYPSIIPNSDIETYVISMRQIRLFRRIFIHSTNIKRFPIQYNKITT